jgi:large subunit ribosomal protein L9
MPTEIILLERVEKLGQMGEVVKVKPGYARNFLLPQRKALRATKENLAYFDAQRKVLEAQNLKKKEEAEKASKQFDGLKVVILRQAGESGHLYGSVASRDIADALATKGITIDRHQVQMNNAFKMIGLFPVSISLHPEVKVQITLNIARSEDEAQKQEKTGKAVIVDHNARDEAPATVRKEAVLEDSVLAEEQAIAAEAAAEAAEEEAKKQKRAAKKAAKSAEESTEGDEAAA